MKSISQSAYEAYAKSLNSTIPFDALGSETRKAWEAAAFAVQFENHIRTQAKLESLCVEAGVPFGRGATV